MSKCMLMHGKPLTLQSKSTCNIDIDIDIIISNSISTGTARLSHGCRNFRHVINELNPKNTLFVQPNYAQYNLQNSVQTIIIFILMHLHVIQELVDMFVD